MRRGRPAGPPTKMTHLTDRTWGGVGWEIPKRVPEAARAGRAGGSGVVGPLDVLPEHPGGAHLGAEGLERRPDLADPPPGHRPGLAVVEERHDPPLQDVEQVGGLHPVPARDVLVAFDREDGPT